MEHPWVPAGICGPISPSRQFHTDWICSRRLWNGDGLVLFRDGEHHARALTEMPAKVRSRFCGGDEGFPISDHRPGARDRGVVRWVGHLGSGFEGTGTARV